MTLRRGSESGVVMVWLATTLTLFLAIAAIVIEGNRKRVMVVELQRVADAASVAAAAELDGSRDGWLKAKRAAASVLKSHLVTGVGNVQEATVRFDSDVAIGKDILEDDPHLQYAGAGVGKLHVRIERGVFWPGSPEAFTSFEGRLPTSVKDSSGRALPLHHSLPIYLLANAVRVTAEARGLRRFFSGLFKGDDGSALPDVFQPISQSAIAVGDSKNEECVVPVAIPACALMLELDPAVQRMYETDSYEAAKQCGRELVATEANPMGPPGRGYYKARGDGIIRSELYPAYTRLGGILNKKGVPLSGVLGTPDVNARGGDTADNNQLLEIFRGGCRRVKLGTRFRPLENAVGAGGLYQTRGEELSNHLRLLLAKARQVQTFKSAFGDPDQKDSAKSNYPWRRFIPDELVQDYKSDNDLTIRVNLKASDKRSDWVNPMCHDWEGGPPNDANAGVADLTLMVVAPTKVNYNTNTGAYCDFGSVFGGQQANTTPPIAETNPVVVGFVKVKMFDFSLKFYGDTGSPNATFDQSPDSYDFLSTSKEDKKPGGNPDDGYLSPEEISDTARTFIDEHLDWAKCQADYESCVAKANADGANDDRCESCVKIRPKGKLDTIKIRKALAPYVGQPAECVNKPNLGILDRLDDFEASSGFPCTSDKRRALLEGLRVCDDTLADDISTELDKAGKVAEPRRYCIPERKANCTDSTNSGCYEELFARSPQWGCGGLRMRLDCQQSSLAFTRGENERQAALAQ